ncbi:MAG: methionyl-tRNA formyltransferase [Flavobacteriaceae bacterium]|nr:methionyl-tRNA formyltransferase [Flavobacteriaceae bacterium]
MKKLRIIFMGTPDFAVDSLKALVESNYNIVGIITAPDKPAGRGRKINESPVKQYALKNDLNILQPINLKSPEFLVALKNLNADLQIVVAFRMLPKQVWAMPRLGTFNLHASLLPDYRGAAPINWAIINGESKTGVTTFFINEKIDTGAILLQEEVEISKTANAGKLHDQLMKKGTKLVLETVDLIQKNNFKLHEQTLKELNQAPKLNKENCKIDWTDTLDNTYNKIRGLDPYPAAWTILNNNNENIDIKIYKVEKIENPHSLIIGTIVSDKKQIKVAVKNGYINILELKLAGKRKMDVKSLLNGYTFFENAKMV